MPGIRRRSFLTGSVASLAAASLVGCTDAVENGLGKPSEPAPTGTVEKFSGEIVVALAEPPPESARKSLTTGYQRRQPNVRIRWETEGWTDADSYATWLETEVAADEIEPDIVSGDYAQDFAGYVDLELYRHRTNPYTGNTWDDDYRFDLYRVPNRAGERVTIGTEATHLFWYYNKEILGDLELEPPRTWTELLNIAPILKDAGVVPVSASFDDVLLGWFPPIYFDQFHTDWVQTVRAQEGDWNWDPELDPAFEFDPTDPALHAKYTYSPQRFYLALREGLLRYDTGAFAEMAGNLAEVFPAFSNPDLFVRGEQYSPFLLGEAALMVDGSWSLALLNRDLDGITDERAAELGIEPDAVQAFEWDVVEFPPMEGGFVQSETVRPPESAAGYSLCAVDKGTDRTAMVMDFLMYWMSEPGYDRFVGGQVRAGDLLPQGPPLVANVSYPPEISDLLERVQQKGILAPRYGDFWVAGGGGRTSDDLQSLFTDLLQGKLTPTKYGKRVQRYVEKNFDELLALADLTESDLANPARSPQSV